MNALEIAVVAGASTLALAGVIAAVRRASGRGPALVAFLEENGLRVTRAGGVAALDPVRDISIFGGRPARHEWTAAGTFRGMPLTVVAYHERGGPRASVTAFTAYITPAPPGWPEIAVEPSVARHFRALGVNPELGGGPVHVQIDHHTDPLIVSSTNPGIAAQLLTTRHIDFLKESCRAFLWWRIGPGMLACVVPGHALRLRTAEEILSALRGFRALMIPATDGIQGADA